MKKWDGINTFDSKRRGGSDHRKATGGEEKRMARINKRTKMRTIIRFTRRPRKICSKAIGWNNRGWFLDVSDKRRFMVGVTSETRQHRMQHSQHGDGKIQEKELGAVERCTGIRGQKKNVSGGFFGFFWGGGGGNSCSLGGFFGWFWVGGGIVRGTNLWGLIPTQASRATTYILRGERLLGTAK